MKIKPIENDEQWFRCIRRAEKTDDDICSLVRILIMSNYNWTVCLRSHGRKHKKERLVKMIFAYYYGLSKSDQHNLINKYFAVEGF